MQAGDTFLIEDRTIDDHLWVIVSDPAKDAQRILIVSLTTATDYKERVCLVQPGEHPWVRHESCIAYDKAKLATMKQLYELKDKGLLKLNAPVTAALLQRIRDRAGDSIDLPLELAEILSEQELVDF